MWQSYCRLKIELEPRINWACRNTSTSRRQGFVCNRIASVEQLQAADRAEAAAVDYYFSSPSENISVPVCIRTPRNRLMIVLWCTFGLPVGGGAISTSLCWASALSKTLPAFAAEHRCLQQVSIIDIWYATTAATCARAQQQTSLTSLLLSIDGTDIRTDGHSTAIRRLYCIIIIINQCQCGSLVTV